jgi:hypothetical protein
MNSEKPKTVNILDGKVSKKMFFNETEDEYEESKIVLPAYLADPSE